MTKDKHPFWLKHKEVLRPVTRSSGATEVDRKKAAFEDLYINNLDKLGLVTMERRSIKNARPTGVTELGRVLLEYIEVPDN